MTEFLVKNFGPVPKLSNAVLVEGLPGIGNVARLCVDYLVDKLKARKFLEVFSDAFPNSVTVTDDSLIRMFSVEFFVAEVNGRSLVFISSDVQPSSDAESYALCSKIVDLALGFGVSEVITIGGIGLPEKPDEVKVHAVLNDLFSKDSLSDLGLVFDGCETVKIILGVTGLLLGSAWLRGLPAFSLLAETVSQSQSVGVKESRAVLRVLTKYLGFELDFSELDKEVKELESAISSLPSSVSDSPVIRQGYIG